METDVRKKKRALMRIASDAERAEITMREMEVVQDRIDQLLASDKNDELLGALSADMRRLRSTWVQQMEAFAELFKEQNTAFLRSIGELHATMKSAVKASDINANAGPLYKTMINHLSGVEGAVKGWKFPQYSAVSVRNKNFANVNPAISPFGIEDYDEIDITYSGSNPTVVVYKLNGTTMGTLTLTYSGSNITKVVRT